MATVLIVDDDKSIRTTVALFLKEAGYEVIAAADAAEAKRWVDRQPMDVALLDIILGKESGLDVARTIRDRQPAVRTILITAEPTFASANQAIRLRIFDYLVKPIGRQALLDVVAQAAAIKAREEEYAVLLLERERSHEVLEKQVRMRTADLHALAARLQFVREEERLSLARELHDNFGQNLTALQIDLQWLDRHLRLAQPLAGALLDKIAVMSTLAHHLTVLTQTACASLRPGMLDDLGLLAAIEWQAEDWAQRTGLTCIVSLPAEEIVIDPNCAVALFRIFQEALTNVVRHAQATHVDVRLRNADRVLHLEVQDNGRGFTPESIPASNALGLLSMRERAAGFEGTVQILSEIGKGTTVQVRMPHTPVAVATGGGLLSVNLGTPLPAVGTQTP